MICRQKGFRILPIIACSLFFAETPLRSVTSSSVSMPLLSIPVDYSDYTSSLLSISDHNFQTVCCCSENVTDFWNVLDFVKNINRVSVLKQNDKAVSACKLKSLRAGELCKLRIVSFMTHQTGTGCFRRKLNRTLQLEPH